MSEDLRRCFSCKELRKCAVKYEDIFCCTLACFTKIQETPMFQAMFKVTEKLRKENLEMQKKIQEFENESGNVAAGSNPAQLVVIDLEDNEVNFPPKISQQQVIKYHHHHHQRKY